MGLEALFGACEHCKSIHRKPGNHYAEYPLEITLDPNVSKETEVVDVFTKGPDNSVDGYHKSLGFRHFEFRTRICKGCLKRWETTDELFDRLNSEWNIKHRGTKIDKVLIVHLKHKILTRQAEKVAQ